MANSNCLIVGASHAGVSLALALRKEGWEEGISVIGAENELPYHRPPLSKEYLSGTKAMQAMRLRPEKMYTDNDIELKLGMTALSIDREAKKLSLQNGESLEYAKLAICTGASVRKLPIGQDIEQVHYLRTAADVALIREQATEARSAVIIGGGYIGLEAAAVLSAMGIRMTVLEMAERILSRVTGQVMADFMTALHREHDVTIKTAAKVVAIEKLPGADRELVITCGDGSELYADFVLVGVGVDPNVGLAESAGLEVNNGIVVNEFAQTSDPDVYSAGDCTFYPSSLYKRQLRLESVQNANDQARVAAANICGKQQSYNAVPWFWSDQYNVKLQMAGLSDGHDDFVVRGDPQNADGGFAVFYFASDQLIAADCVKRPKEFMLGKLLVQSSAEISKDLLADDSSDPMTWKALVK